MTYYASLSVFTVISFFLDVGLCLIMCHIVFESRRVKTVQMGGKTLTHIEPLYSSSCSDSKSDNSESSSSDEIDEEFEDFMNDHEKRH